MQKKSLKTQNQNQIFLNSNTTLPKTYFQLIQKVGSQGKYQRNMFILFMMVLFTLGTILLSPSFLFMNDQYACQELGLIVLECKKTVCEIQDHEQRAKYFVKNKDDIKSVASEYGPFMCEDQYILDMIKSCPYFGALIGYILSSFVADNIGRKNMMTVSLGISSLGAIVASSGFNIPMIVIGSILSGVGINVACGMAFCYLAQTVQDKKRQKYSILVQVTFTLGTMSLTGLYALIGNWRIISIILQTIPVVITFLLFVFYAQDTPLFLLKGSNKSTLKALNRIGYINYDIKDILSQQDIDNVRRQQLTSESFNNKKITPLDLMKFKSLRFTTIGISLLGFVIFSLYYGPVMIIDKIGFNTFVSSFAIQLSQLISYVPCYFYIDKVNRQSTGFFLYLAIVVCSFGLILLNKPQNCYDCYQGIAEVIIIFVFRLALGIDFIMFMVYSIELFPTRVMGVASAVTGIGSTIASTLSSIIVGALERLEFNLMLFFMILGLFGCALSLLLNQTHNKPIQTEIEQITWAKNKKKTQYIEEEKSSSLTKSKQYL